MAQQIHLVVEKGEDKGLRVHIPPEGARVGRSSKNDVVLVDPLLSRHHCRLFFKPGEGLWVTDLGSANETIVNNETIQEKNLQTGDRIMLGDTVLKVVNDGITGISAGDMVDLGLSPEQSPASRTKLTRGPLLIIAALMAVLAAVVWVPKLLKSTATPPPAPVQPEAPVDWPVELRYEKVEADADNIFRYYLQLGPDRTLSIEIDDIANDRHVRKEKQIAEDYVHYLVDRIENAGFFGLNESYEGLQPGVLESWDVEITIGRRHHRARVVNRVEPDAFKATRELLEECGKQELGLWAIQFSAEKLLEMARDAFLLGQKLYDERQVEYGNLAGAIKSFEEADWYLETVEPKPDFYDEILALRREARELLDEQYNDQNFSAKRAVRMREWEEAAHELRVILEMIPDRSDPRHEEARKELIEIENRRRLES